MHWRDDPNINIGHVKEIDEALREAYYRRPFVPVEIVLKDGRRFLVENSGQIGFPPAYPVVHIVMGEGDHDFYPLQDVQDVAIAKRKVARKSKAKSRRKAA